MGSLAYPVSMSLDVSVPCEKCGDAIRFGQVTCPGCRSPVSRDLRRALEERLEASSSDFRSMRNRVREVGILLLVLGLLTLVLGGFVFFSYPESIDPNELLYERVGLAFNCVVGCSMLVASRLVDTHPQKTIIIVFAGWVLIQVLVVLVFPLALFTGLVEKFVTLLVLGRGFVSARAAQGYRLQLAREAIEG